MNDDEERAEDDGSEPLPNAADERAIKKRISKARRSQIEAERFWKSVFADEIGRREMWGILQAAHAFEERFACGPNGFPQPEATWFQAGIQSVGQRLFQSWMLLDREGVFLMLDEHDPRFTRKSK
jgi:hypothetical protein